VPLLPLRARELVVPGEGFLGLAAWTVRSDIGVELARKVEGFLNEEELTSVSQARTEAEGKVAGCYRRRRWCLGCFGAINTTSSGAFYKFCPSCVF